MTETKQEGEYRNLTPQEIGHAITTFRKMLGMKQITLALDAGVDERTVQRIERGEKANDDTLRRVAKVLGMHEGALLGPRYVSTREEAIAKVEGILSEVLVIDAIEFTTVRDCDAVLGAHGYIVNDQHVSHDLIDTVAGFKDLLEDWDWISHHLSHTDRIKACHSILNEVQKIEGAGYRTRYAVYATDDQCRVSVLMFVPKADEHLSNMSQFVVPRNFAKMAQDWQKSL
jgi:transcriptional regulator with XRE-family HTH domain